MTYQDLLWPTRTLYDIPGPCMIHQDLVWHARALYDKPGPCMIYKDLVWYTRTLYDMPGSCMTHWDLVWSTRTLYDIPGPCMPRQDLVQGNNQAWKCVNPRIYMLLFCAVPNFPSISYAGMYVCTTIWSMPFKNMKAELLWNYIPYLDGWQLNENILNVASRPCMFSYTLSFVPQLLLYSKVYRTGFFSDFSH